ncbi:Nicotinate catabolism cluster hxnY [Hyphodiscus hymeniophilus]|uniref:Nicotinate catabolism cluster hxnY n=1 Tax=Hyphodiscus hymeniophilus TaxID=353542 RepID=A0A9P6VR50_9HELO|nr:Nicotinate catabolism cluster hxnY [Hyphodiscus hymeniophilus]
MAPSALLPEPEPEYVVVHAGKGTIKRQILTGDKKKPTFETIPQVDFSKMSSSSLSERKAVAEEVNAAFRHSGFLYAVNHGISEELQSELSRVIKEFFDLPLEEKMKVIIQLIEFPPVLTIDRFMLDETTRGDLKEAFAAGEDPYDPEQNPPEDLDWSKFSRNGNQWPASKEFRTIMYQYSAAILDFSRNLMRTIALALDLDEHHFDDMAKFPTGGLRALHYPSQETSNDVGIGAHADYSWFTLVNQLSDTPALEVLNHNGQWVSAPPIRNTLVVNVGDLLEMATNNEFVSTVHRVVNKTGKERYSIPYFFAPTSETMIETFPSCVTSEKPAMKPIKSGDWLRERLLRARYKHPSSVAARARGEI